MIPDGRLLRCRARTLDKRAQLSARTQERELVRVSAWPSHPGRIDSQL
jgi:hypothetical protein